MLNEKLIIGLLLLKKVGGVTRTKYMSLFPSTLGIVTISLVIFKMENTSLLNKTPPWASSIIVNLT